MQSFKIDLLEAVKEDILNLFKNQKYFFFYFGMWGETTLQGKFTMGEGERFVKLILENETDDDAEFYVFGLSFEESEKLKKVYDLITYTALDEDGNPELNPFGLDVFLAIGFFGYTSGDSFADVLEEMKRSVEYKFLVNVIDFLKIKTFDLPEMIVKHAYLETKNHFEKVLMPSPE